VDLVIGQFDEGSGASAGAGTWGGADLSTGVAGPGPARAAKRHHSIAIAVVDFAPDYRNTLDGTAIHANRRTLQDNFGFKRIRNRTLRCARSGALWRGMPGCGVGTTLRAAGGHLG